MLMEKLADREPGVNRFKGKGVGRMELQRRVVSSLIDSIGDGRPDVEMRQDSPMRRLPYMYRYVDVL